MEDKPLCCYRHFTTISEDIGLSERYIGRIVDILAELKIIKYTAMKRERYIKGEKIKYHTTPKIFADYRHFIRDKYGNQIIDNQYDPDTEIKKQIRLLSNDKDN